MCFGPPSFLPLLLQFPKLYEGEAARLVHHSVEMTEQLCDTILAHLATRFVQVRRRALRAACWLPAQP